MAELELAPVAIIRAAVWPVEMLRAFGDPELAARAAAANELSGPERQLVEEAYARAVEREREHLWAATVGNPRFHKALMLANPPLARRAVALRGRRAPLRRIRRLEYALFRHLSRAVGRTEPCDLWAGAALAAWSSETVVERERARIRAYPDLRPFQAMVRALARRTEYRRSASWRANATLARMSDGGWRYLARRHDGRVVERRTAPNALADRLVPALPRGSETLERMADGLQTVAALGRPTVIDVLDSYVDAGILVGGLDLPARFATPWEALSRAGGQLREPDSSAWNAATTTLGRICDVLERGLHDLCADEVGARLDDASRTVSQLAQDLGLDSIELPRTVLRCDIAPPWRITLGPELRARLVRAVAEYDRLHEHSSLRGAVRRGLASRLSPEIEGGRPLADLAGAYASLRVDAATWEEVVQRARLDPSPVCGPHGSEAAPLGCLLVELRGARRHSPTFAIRGAFDEVAPLYARYAGLWGPVCPFPRDQLYRWLRDELEDVGRRCGVAIVELAGPCEANPNALAGPRLAREVVELWTTSEHGDGLVGAEVFADPVSRSPLVRRPEQPRATALFSFAAADIAQGDPVSEVLLQTSFRVAPGSSFKASSLASELELRSGRPRPGVHLPSGALAQPRRTILAGDTLARLLDERGASRYVVWQRLAREHSWAAWVRVRTLGAHGLLIPTASPLAVEAVLDRVAPGTRMLDVEDADLDAWLTDGSGARFVAELAVPFRRQRHAWSSRGGQENGTDGG